MKAEITYQMGRIENPYKDQEGQGDMVWTLVRVTTPEYGEERHEPVAYFNRDSEALGFQGHVLSCETSGRSVVVLDDETIRVLKELKSNELG